MRRIYWMMLLIAFAGLSCESGPSKLPDPPSGQFVFGTENSEVANSVQELPGGDLLIIGGAQEAKDLDYDAILMRVTRAGEVVWTKRYGLGNEDEQGYELIPFGSGYALLAVSAPNRESNRSFRLFLLDADYTQLEDHRYLIPGSAYSDAGAVGFFATSDGGFLMSSSLSGSPFLYKVDANLDNEWELSISDFYSYGRSHAVLRHGNGFVVCGGGYNGYYGSNPQVTFYFINEQGGTYDSRFSGNFSFQSPRVSGMARMQNGDYVMNLHSDRDGNFYQARLDSLGNVLWENPLVGLELNRIRAISGDRTASVGFRGAYYNNVNPATDAFLVRGITSGTTDLSVTLGGDNTDKLHDVIETTDGKLVAVGMTMSYGNGLSDIYLVIREQ